MCDSPSVSDEHAPPKCFFPKTNRKQLVTVPSCDDHNLKTSNDDEYVRNILVTFEGCNELAGGVFGGKAKRSFDNSPKLFKKTFQNVVWKEVDGTKKAAFELDFERVENTMHKIKAALHFNHFDEKVTWKTSTFVKQLVGEDLQDGGAGKLFALLDSEGLEWFGDNPEVFKYRMVRYPGMPSTFHFVFFEGVDVMVTALSN